MPAKQKVCYRVTKAGKPTLVNYKTYNNKP